MELHWEGSARSLRSRLAFKTAWDTPGVLRISIFDKNDVGSDISKRATLIKKRKKKKFNASLKLPLFRTGYGGSPMMDMLMAEFDQGRVNISVEDYRQLAGKAAFLFC